MKKLLPCRRTASTLRLLAFTGGVVVATLFAAPIARSQSIIVSDGFSGADGTALNSRSPDTTNRPGSTYTSTSFVGGGSYPMTLSGNTLQTDFNDSAYLSIASTGTYSKPVVLTLGLSVQIGTVTENGQYARGIGLGFYAAAPTAGADAATGFTGLNVEPNGTLVLVINGTRTGAATPAPASFSTGAFYPLSFTLNTTTGAISNVFYNGVNDSSYFTTATTSLTNANTNLVGFYASSASSASDTGYVDNFSVSTVPEPDTWVAVAVGASLLGLTLRRSRLSAPRA